MSDNYRYRDSWISDNFREREPSKKKQRTVTKNDAKRIKNDIFTRSTKEKSNIAIGKMNDWMAPQ